MFLSEFTTVQATTGVNPPVVYALLTTIVIIAIAIFITDVRIATKKEDIRKIATFEKISFDVFSEDMKKNVPSPTGSDWTIDELTAIYNSIKMPERKTSGAAGYDILAPFDINIPFGTSLVIPTGLRCKMNEAWDLEIVPRSGSGFKYGIRLANTTGIIDADYYYSDRGGHIMVKLVNNDPAVNTKELAFHVDKENGFAQGLFRYCGLTLNDNATAQRSGGFGSTDKKKQ